MNRNQLIEGISVFGIGVILYVIAMELPSVVQGEGIVFLEFVIRLFSYFAFVIGAIMIIISVIPENIGKDKKWKNTY